MSCLGSARQSHLEASRNHGKPYRRNARAIWRPHKPRRSRSLPERSKKRESTAFPRHVACCIIYHTDGHFFVPACGGPHMLARERRLPGLGNHGKHYSTLRTLPEHRVCSGDCSRERATPLAATRIFVHIRVRSLGPSSVPSFKPRMCPKLCEKAAQAPYRSDLLSSV